ncbi:hypothetical protein [Hymenobacter sp. YC55]|uniref:hypothetical protein n=1 Tax=Hymenobacter sp. YC55 TaxID=3034019 RepID=UPI0023F97971|nr:hypothetical protein [Hymenobacter sp. YC55]MDF7813627.1 hypothetical protein [Hymenobacter sp. YC55]
MDLITKLIEYLTDPKRHVSSKVIILIFLVLSAIFINDITGFTYYSNIENRISKIKDITELRRDSSLSASTKAKLIALETEVMNRKNIIEYMSSLAAEASNSMHGISFKYPKQAPDKHADVSEKPQIVVSSIVYPTAKSGFIHLMTSSGIYIIVGIILVPILLAASANSSLTDILGGLLILAVITFGLSWINYFLFGLIPQIGNSWKWNYYLNCVLQVLVMIFYYVLGSNVKTKA